MTKEVAKKRLLKLRRFWIMRILSLFSLSAAAFIFQACYGMPQDYEDDVFIQGKVVASDTQEPIEGILVEAEKYGTQATTDDDGNFNMYVPEDDEYRLLFYDVDSLENGFYYAGKKDIDNPGYYNNISVEYNMNRVDD